MTRNYVFILDKELSDSENGTISLDSIINDFRQAGIEVVAIKEKFVAFTEKLIVKVKLHNDYWKTEADKFKKTKSARYLFGGF